MSTIIIKYNPGIGGSFNGLKPNLATRVVQVTARVLNKQEKEVIVDFEAWSNPKPENAPDILLRAETSPSRRDKLDEWGKALLTVLQEVLDKLSTDRKIRIAVKPYVIDSLWMETSKL